jgi:crotonyl-CoA carboxylase/reductase
MRAAMAKDIYALGEVPALGDVPARMHAQIIRNKQFGEPKQAFVAAEVPVPEIGPREVLVYVMAAGVNYNNVWAAQGIPINVIAIRNKKGEPEDFHIGGSDASGIVWKVGKDVKNVKVGDEVVTHCGWWNHDDPHVVAGKDPMFAPSQLIWGYETNWGSFAQFTKVQDHMCLPKPKHLAWEGAAAYMLVGATAYRMLHGWAPNVVREGEPVLIWGGSGGLGSMAIQIARAAGAKPVAVISDRSQADTAVVRKGQKAEFCIKLGAVGVINRLAFKHWGELPHHGLEAINPTWLEGCKAFGKAFWEALGEKRNPTIVFDHPGEDTVPTSDFICETGGMIVICAGTTGYKASLDLRYHWMKQKRFQGSHFANDEQAKGINDLVIAGKVDPCMAERVFEFNETGECHQLMFENKHPAGNMSILVNARQRGQKTLG